MMKTAGLDIGTTGCKLTVFDEKGERLGNAYREYPAAGKAGPHETDISAMKECVFAVIREMSDLFPDIRAVRTQPEEPVCLFLLRNACKLESPA